MSSELRKMIDGIPVDVWENTKTDCVYMGSGTVQGLEKTEVTVLVFLRDGKKVASVRTWDREHSGPFETAREQEAFTAGAKRFILSGMN